MSNLKMIQNITGWFDVKVYNDRQPRENWKLKSDTDNIAFIRGGKPGGGAIRRPRQALHRQRRKQPRPRDIQDRRQVPLV